MSNIVKYNKYADKNSDFITIFVPDYFIILKDIDRKMSMIKFEDKSVFWIPTSCVQYQQKSKTGRIYSSVSINKNWDYKIFENKQLVDELSAEKLVKRLIKLVKK